MTRFPPSIRTKGWKGAYYTWYNMVQRCTKTDHPAWPHYGGRGIRVCDRWLDFRSFLADMGEKPEGSRISLERLDNDADYGPDNCIWATPLRQARNTRRTKLRPELVCMILDLERHGLSVGEIARRVDYMPNGVGIILGTVAIIRSNPRLLSSSSG